MHSVNSRAPSTTAGSDLPASQTERKLGSYACMVLQLEIIMHSGLCQLIITNIVCYQYVAIQGAGQLAI